MLRVTLVFAYAFARMAQTLTCLLSGILFDNSGAAVTGASVNTVPSGEAYRVIQLVWKVSF